MTDPAHPAAVRASYDRGAADYAEQVRTGSMTGPAFDDDELGGILAKAPSGPRISRLRVPACEHRAAHQQHPQRTRPGADTSTGPGYWRSSTAGCVPASGT
ncbi:hypothetical protein OG819_04475 [Streptomyces sp. NBC_01549]|uniref:hypothetical protein n=1 Tax=Streptomyces sp. NBC_01549 TaxID=2975874 RepID=UPI002258FC54|nr:hypothetical protein [Streptomyces sp. NBC_01549]MCX4589025.1 hypothetical protein [Streptomyces sp. NBC_01549]